MCRHLYNWNLKERIEIAVPKVGPVKIKYHRPIPENAQIKTLTISKEADKWFACFSFEQEFDPELKPVDGTIGIDLGLKDFWYGSDGRHVVVPKFLRKLEQKLKKFQTKLSKAVKGSPRYYKLLKIVRKIHYRIKCQRMDFLHKTANRLLSEFDVIVHEDLKIKNIIRRPKSKLEAQSFRVGSSTANWKFIPPSTNQAVRGGFIYIHLNGLAITYS